MKPSIRAIAEFKNAIEALGSRMGNTLALLRVADILQQAKKMEESGELVAPFLSMQKETPSNAWPPLRMHFIANVPKQRGVRPTPLMHACTSGCLHVASV